MRLDYTHRNWLTAAIFLTLGGGVLYAVSAILSPIGPRGDSPVGLSFGIAAGAMSLIAGALAVRKKMLLARVGSVASWMRGHLWLGAAVLPFACFHGGFRLGGTLTTVLMSLMIVVVITGLLGAALQHAMPRIMIDQLSGEHTFDQLDRMRWNLRLEAYEAVAAVCGRIAEAEGERQAIEGALGAAPRERKTAVDTAGLDAVRLFYADRVVPYLSRPRANGTPLAGPATRAMSLDDLRLNVDVSLHPIVDRLGSHCAAGETLQRQATLHRWLHGWLLIHVPASVAFLLLMVIHAVAALYY